MIFFAKTLDKIDFMQYNINHNDILLIGGWLWLLLKRECVSYFIMSYFPYVYATVEKECQIEGYRYIGYGICVRDVGTGREISFHDISVRREDI